MNKSYRRVVEKLLSMAVVAVLCGCGWSPSGPAVPARPGTSAASTTQPGPQSMTLYSINGREELTTDQASTADEQQTEEIFHHFPVLGKLEIATAEQRIHVLNTLNDAIEKSDGTMNKCFWPRHGIRTVENGKTIDYVICFECLQLKIHEGSKETRKAIVRNPEDEWNQILTAAGITIAPK